MHTLLRLAMIGSCVLGCSKGPKVAPASRLQDATVDGASGDRSATGETKGPPMTAETSAQRYYETKGWKVVKLVPFARVPHLFRAEFADGVDYVLIHNDQPVTTKGVEALATYAREVDLAAKPDLDTLDLTTLLFVFDAYPPVSGGLQRNAFFDGPEHPSLKPTLATVGGGGIL